MENNNNTNNFVDISSETEQKKAFIDEKQQVLKEKRIEKKQKQKEKRVAIMDEFEEDDESGSNFNNAIDHITDGVTNESLSYGDNIDSLAYFDLTEVNNNTSNDDLHELLEMMQEELIAVCDNTKQQDKFEDFDLTEIDPDQVSTEELLEILEETQLKLRKLHNNIHDDKNNTKLLTDNDHNHNNSIDLSKETTSMAEYLEKEKFNNQNAFGKRNQRLPSTTDKNNEGKNIASSSEEKRLTTLKVPRAEDWMEYYIDGKLQVLLNQKQINPAQYIIKLNVISCHNLRTSDITSVSQPFVTIIAPDMDKYENQYKFTTYQTSRKKRTLNPIFNETFYLPLFQGDVEAILAIEKKKRPYNRKEKERCGLQIYVKNHDDEMGDHESLGDCMLWFSEMDLLPIQLDEKPTKITIRLSGKGSDDENNNNHNQTGLLDVKSGWSDGQKSPVNNKNISNITVEACICPTLTSLWEIEKRDQEEIQERLQLREEKRIRDEEARLMKEQEEKEEINRQKLQAIDEAKMKDRQRSDNPSRDRGLSAEDIATVKDLVKGILSKNEVKNHKNDQVDRHGSKFRAYLSLAKLARATNTLRTLVGRQMYGAGLSMALADLAHKMERMRCAAAALLASLGHDSHAGNIRLLKAHSGFQIDDIHIFWVPESLRDAYLDAGSRLKAEASQRERDGRRKLEQPKWWPPSEKGFVTFLRTKLSRALAKNVGTLDNKTFCDHTGEASPVQLICFPPSKPYEKKISKKGKGMAWFLSVLQEQAKNGNMFSLLNDLKSDEKHVGPSVEDFEAVLSQYEFRQSIDDYDFQRFISIFTIQIEASNGNVLVVVNLEEMKRALAVDKNTSMASNVDTNAGANIVNKTMELLQGLAHGGATVNVNEFTKEGLDRVYNMIDLNDDDTIDTKELLLVLQSFVNNNNDFNEIEEAALINHFDMSRTGKINRERFEDKIINFEKFDGNIDENNLFQKLADGDTADIDAGIMKWMPDPQIYLLGIRIPTQQPQGGTEDDNAYLRDRNGRAVSSQAAILGESEPNDGGATAKEIADIARLRKLFQRLDFDKVGSVTLDVLQNDEVFLELFGRRNTTSLLIHFKKSTPGNFDDMSSKRKDYRSTAITWEQFLDYRRFLLFTEKLRKQKEEEENFKNRPVQLFVIKPKDGMPRFKESIVQTQEETFINSNAEKIKFPTTYVSCKVHGEPKTQCLRFDVSLRPSDGSLYRLRLPMRTIIDARNDDDEDEIQLVQKKYTLEDIFTLEKDIVEPFLQKMILPKFHVHKGDDTIKLKDTICDVTTTWCNKNGYYLLRQIRKGKGIALVLKMKEPDMIAIRGLSIAQELYKQRRLPELWSVLQETTHHIIRSCPTSAARTIMETKALDQLISGYKKAKAMHVKSIKIQQKDKQVAKEAKAIFAMRDSIRTFRKSFINAIEAGHKRRVGIEQNAEAIRVESAPTYVERKTKRKIRDQKRLCRIVTGNRARIKRTVTTRLDHLQSVAKIRDETLQAHRKRQMDIEKQRQKDNFLIKQQQRIEKARAEQARAKEERQWMLQERRLKQKQEKMLRKEKAKLEEDRKQKNMLAGKARIEKRQAHLLALANADSDQDDTNHNTWHGNSIAKAKATFNHEQLLKFGEKIAIRRKALGVNNDARITNAQRYGYSDRENRNNDTDGVDNGVDNFDYGEELEDTMIEENNNEAGEESNVSTGNNTSRLQLQPQQAINKEELQRVEKERRRQANLARFNMDMLNQEQEEEYKDTKIEKGREIHEGEVNDEEIQRIEKEKRKQANLARFNRDMQTMGDNLQDYY